MIDTLLRQRGHVLKHKSGGEYATSCPYCGGTDRFCVWPEKDRGWCRQCEKNPDSIQLLRDLDGLTFKEAKEALGRGDNGDRPQRKPMKLGPTEETYTYTNEEGNLISRVLRFKSKEFRQQKWTGSSWEWGVKGIPQVLYNLPAVQAASDPIVVEGEKDANILMTLGFTATTNLGGAGKWRKEYSDALAGKDVVLIPDNDEPGREHMRDVAASLKGKARSIKVLDLPGLPEKGDVSDFIASFKEPEEAAERLAIMIEGAKEYEPPEEGPAGRFEFTDAGTLIDTEPPPADPIIEGVVDLADKLLVVGPTKTWKTFFLILMALCLAAGRRFLNWDIPAPRRVSIINFEVTPGHTHRRIRGIAQAKGIRSEDLGGRLHILNARGLGITGPAGIEELTPSLEAHRPEVILFDPLYKVAEGDENHAEDAKAILAAFDKLARTTGAMIGFVHHDPKGVAGDRNIRDRGAGSNVVARDYDACFALTPHASQETAVVVDTLLRNYPPQESTTIVFEDQGVGPCFYPGDGLAPEKQTSQNGKKAIPFRQYTGAVEAILNGSDEMHVADFKEALQEKTGFSNNKIKEFMRWATGGKTPLLCTRSERSRGKHDRFVWMNTDEGMNPRLDFNEG